MKVYNLYFTHEPDMYGTFKTKEQAQACIDMMLEEYGDPAGEEYCSPEDFEIEEVYLQ